MDGWPAHGPGAQDGTNGPARWSPATRRQRAHPGGSREDGAQGHHRPRYVTAAPLAPDRIDESAVRQVAQRAEALGFHDLWVTNNTVDVTGCFDSLTVLTYAAALTPRFGWASRCWCCRPTTRSTWRIRWATLDYLSGGRAILGVGLGRDSDYPPFQIPRERRVRRFTESIELIKALWTQPTRDLPGRDLPGGERDDRHEAGAVAASADLDRRPATRTRSAGRPRSRTAGWAPAARRRPRSRPTSRCCARRSQAGRDPRLPDLQARLHVRPRARGGGQRRGGRWFTRGLPQPERHGRPACTAPRSRSASSSKRWPR